MLSMPKNATRPAAKSLIIKIVIPYREAVLPIFRNPRGRGMLGAQEEESSVGHVIAIKAYFCCKGCTVSGGIIY